MNRLFVFVFLIACGDNPRSDQPMANHGHEPEVPTAHDLTEPEVDSAQGYIEAPTPVRVAVIDDPVERKACEGKMDVGQGGELICVMIDTPTPTPPTP